MQSKVHIFLPKRHTGTYIMERRIKVYVKRYKTGLCCNYWIFAQRTGLDRTSITVTNV